MASIALFGCAAPVDHAPAEMVAFRKNGVDYQWALIHGSGGSLTLVRMNGVGGGTPQALISCDDRERGGMQFRGDLAHAGTVSISTPDARFAVEATPRDGFDTPVVQGEGRFPSGWFRALAGTDVVTFASGDRVFDVPAPGAPAVEHYERYCRRLG